ncbi:hypothetical protein RGF97_20915 [Streptomyces roseicoloratus]|uniref:Lipoprotein n=1 Tax=Streptomyces roseicoloratus TaxID=2508722 RepID=A0ABY9RYJ5_9ACTN|nr:hypothetical protein [Streptomyces roseicoloratus]WMX46793.1 hypothetical protein RGF97_20915 [Streptomyces roseicoloratus]
MLLTACSGGGDADAEAEAGLRGCEEVFGAAGVSKVRAVVGDNKFRGVSTPWSSIARAMLKEARQYDPDGEDWTRSRHEPCELSANGIELRRIVEVHVKWSVLTMDTLETGASKVERTEVAQDVYIERQNENRTITAILPCKVSGTAPEQRSALPLEVIAYTSSETGAEGDSLAATLLPSLVRNTQKHLGCEKPVAVPEVLLP